uniref:Uncharacterized protein n=1 Tax=Daphnia magna TaxID=35525 RepID=A0A0P5P5C5_9CRUS
MGNHVQEQRQISSIKNPLMSLVVTVVFTFVLGFFSFFSLLYKCHSVSINQPTVRIVPQS